MLRGAGLEITSSSRHQRKKRITPADLAKLPEEQRRHISVYEQAMRANYSLWEKLYPKLNRSRTRAVNERRNQEMQSILANISEALNSLLDYLGYLGLDIDDHYEEFRYLAGQAAAAQAAGSDSATR
jgi:hypothetical protein